MAFTYFFRDLQTLELIVENLVPFVSGKSSIKIWDAGCASGEEPFTLAILLAESMGKFSFKNVKIYATDLDVSNQFKEIIENGIYDYEQLQRIPVNLFEKYFVKISESKYQIIQLIRDRIIFKREDLLKLKETDNEFSLILCKNVLLHFQYSERVDVIKMFQKALCDGGYFATEQTQKMPDETAYLFNQVVPNAQLFKKV